MGGREFLKNRGFGFEKRNRRETMIPSLTMLAHNNSISDPPPHGCHEDAVVSVSKKSRVAQHRVVFEGNSVAGVAFWRIFCGEY